MSDNDTRGTQGKGAADHGANADPDWADGLKRLYDSVVDEPLPSAFTELLAKLDNGDTA